MDFPALRARAHISGLRPVDYAPGGAVDYGLRPVDYGPIGPVDFPALRARAHISASGARCGLRDYRPCGLRTLVRAVDYGLHPVDFPALRARAQEMRGDSNQARGKQAVF